MGDYAMNSKILALLMILPVLTLFSDASRINLRELSGHTELPGRIPVIAQPLIVVLRRVGNVG